MSSQLIIKQCYDSTGQLRRNDVPCDPYAEVSACCGTADSQCSDNLHCINPAGQPVPGTCTFSSWVSGTEPACPCPPISVEGQNLDYRNGVTFCPDGGYCCGASNFDCCNNGDSKPIINYGLEGEDIPNTTSRNPTSALSSYYEDLAVSTQSISRTTSSETTSTTIASSSTSSPTSSVSSPTATSTPSSSGLSAGAQAGIGVGIGVTVIAVIILIAVFVLRRRRRTGQITTSGATPVEQGYYDNQQHQQKRYQQMAQMPHEAPTVPARYENDANRTSEPSELDSGNYSSSGSQTHMRR